MELCEVESVVAVADEAHFGHAAAQLNVATSTVSDRVRALEDRLGVRLFERTSRRVGLTDAGRELVPVLRALVEAADRARAAAEVVARRQARTVRVAADRECLDGMAPMLAAFHSALPDGTVEVTAVHRQGFGARLLRGGEIDALLFRAPVGGGAAVATAWRAPLDVILPVTWDAAHRSTLSLAEVAALPLRRPDDLWTGHALEHALLLQGLRPLWVDVGDREAWTVAARGSCAEPGFVAVPLVDGDLTIPTYLASRRGPPSEGLLALEAACVSPGPRPRRAERARPCPRRRSR